MTATSDLRLAPLSPLTAAFRRDTYRRMLYAVTTLPGLAWCGLVLGASAVFRNVLVLPLGVLAAAVLAPAVAPLERARWRWYRRGRAPDPAVPDRRARSGRRGFWPELGYLLASVVTGAIGLGFALVWLVVSVRNLVIFPLYYSWARDLSAAWGGPTWVGAVTVNVLLGFAVFLAVPWLLGRLATVQSALAGRLLVVAESPGPPVGPVPGQGARV